MISILLKEVDNIVMCYDGIQHTESHDQRVTGLEIPTGSHYSHPVGHDGIDGTTENEGLYKGMGFHYNVELRAQDNNH